MGFLPSFEVSMAAASLEMESPKRIFESLNTSGGRKKRHLWKASGYIKLTNKK
jgi:hypothetical protein